MRRIALILAGLTLVFAAPTFSRADPFCGPSEGCPPCPPPTITVDKSGVHIQWIYC